MGLLILSVLSCALSQAGTDTFSAAIKEYMENPNRAVVLRGDYFKAAKVAFEDFPRTLAEYEAQGQSANAAASDSAARFSTVENYDITIDQKGPSYVIHIWPTKKDPTHVEFGGGLRYVIDRKTFTITEKSLLK